MSRGTDEDDELVPLPVEPRRAVVPLPPAPPAIPRRLRRAALGVALAGVAGAVSYVGLSHDGVRRARSGEAVLGRTDERAPEGWRRGSPGPLRHRDFAVEVWTGSELVVWGGDPDGDSGAAYDPAADRWRTVLPATITARCQATAAWTGQEMLVWGPGCAAGAPTAAAAYSPAGPGGNEHWRTLPAGPLPDGDPPVSAWTGREWLVLTPGGAIAAFDPDGGPGGVFEHEGSWRDQPAAPRRFTAATAAWTGREMVVLGNEARAKGPASAGPVFDHWVAALDPRAGRWRTLPDPPLELAATAVWNGRELVAWDQNLHAAALDPSGAGAWRALPDVPVDFRDCSPEGAMVGDAVFAEECGRGALFRSDSSAWDRIAHPRSLSEPPIWTGRDALFWVGSFAGSADGVWLYRPPSGPAGPDGRHQAPVPLHGGS
jgi:hypothetical protein